MHAIETLIEPATRDLGGFSVRRVLPFLTRRMVGPFIFFDHMGPVEFQPGSGIDVRPHPHVCLATVTYLFEGEIVHRDSLGFVQTIRPGDVNWMTAGRGIVHSERSGDDRANGQRLHGIQSWVALPESAEETAPGFCHYPRDTLPLIERGRVTMRLIAGNAFVERSPVQTFSDMFYLDAHMPEGSALTLPPEHEDRAIYIVEGEIGVGGQQFLGGRMAVFTPGADIEIHAREDSRLMLLGGEPLGERHIWWNFVASSKQRIEQAKNDWKNRRFSKVPGETEFIPLPDK